LTSDPTKESTLKKYLAALVAVSMLAVPTSAVAHDGGSLKHKNKYLRAQVFKLGASPGRDIVTLGRRPGKDASIHEYLETMRRMIAPPPAPAPAPAPATPASQPTAAPAPAASGGAGGVLASIRACESGGNYATNTGNGFYGAYQFTDQTWHAMGGSGHASDASPAEQDARASALYAGGAGAGNWPVCAR
jgi:hypothetical protein